MIAAARQAHVGRGTYYYWRDRYVAEGTAGLKHEHSRAPQRPRLAPISAEICAEGLAYYEACLLYTSDAADERSSVALGGRRII